jgi:hypothetical protein
MEDKIDRFIPGVDDAVPVGERSALELCVCALD